MGLRALVILMIAAAVSAGAAHPAAAQDARAVIQTPIVTIDQDRLFAQSLYGKEILNALDQQSVALAADNRRIEADLTAEEKALTEERPRLDAATFREKADAFDKKVVAIRQEQDNKARDLVQRREAVRQGFFKDALPILTEIVRAHGAVVVMETRAVILSADQIDITDEAIARIDARMAGKVAPQTGDAPTTPGND